MPDTQGNNPPIKTLRAGQVEAAIWSQQKEQDGRTYVQHSTRIQKRYKDKDGMWKSTDYFWPGDLADLALVTRKAMEFTRLRESGHNACRDLAAAVARLRRWTPNPDLIHLHHDLTRMLRLCGRCPAANARRLSRSEPFACLLAEDEPADAAGSFRYRLDDRGQIVEH